MQSSENSPRPAVAAGHTDVVENWPELMRSPRLVLRRWVEADADALNAAVAASLDHLRPWMPWISTEPLDRPRRSALIRQWHADWDGDGDFVVGVFDDGQVIGGAGLHRRRGPGALEIGYWIHIDHLRRGYASEVAATLTTVAFTVKGVERVEIHHDKANIASAGVPARLGYAYSGESPDAVTAPGEVGTDCRWVMTRRDWASSGWRRAQKRS